MLHAVVYTDGSARPNPGYSGWGFHAYVYDPEVKTISKQPPKYKTTNNGYLLPEQIKMEMGEVISPMHYFDAAGPCFDEGTNNIAEMTALKKALEYFSQDFKVDKITINTDSEYVIYGLKRDLKDVRDTSKNIANPEDWFDILTLVNELEDLGIELIVRKVKAHDVDLGNNMADQMANVGRLICRAGDKEGIFKQYAAKGYWSIKNPKHPLMSYRTLFISGNRDDKEQCFYYLYHADSKLPFGKTSSKTLYLAMRLKEPVGFIDGLIEEHNKLLGSEEAPSIVRLDVLLSLQVMMLYRSFGKYVLTPPPKNGSKGVYFLEEIALTKVIWPPGLVHRMVVNFSNLRRLVVGTDEELTKEGYEGIDISNFLEEDTEEKKDTVRIKTEEKGTKLSVKLFYGRDLPARPLMKKLIKQGARIRLLTKKDGKILRYVVRVDTEDTTSVWSDLHASFTI